MKTTKALDVSDLYDLIFKFDEHVDSSFQETGTELDTIRSRLARRGQEIANLEGGYKSLEEEVDALKGRLDERDEAIAVRATLHPDAPAALELSIARTRVLDYL